MRCQVLHCHNPSVGVAEIPVPPITVPGDDQSVATALIHVCEMCQESLARTGPVDWAVVPTRG